MSVSLLAVISPTFLGVVFLVVVVLAVISNLSGGGLLPWDDE